MLAASIGLGGCSIFGPPPAELVAAADLYVAQIRAVPGVAKAEVDVSQVDPKDRAGVWGVRVLVDAATADDLASVPAAIAGITQPQRAETSVVIRVPGGHGVAPVVLSSPTEGDVEASRVLRELPFVAKVILAEYGDSVQLLDRTLLATAVVELRRSGVLTSDLLEGIAVGWGDGRGSAQVSLAGPSDAVVGVFDSLMRDANVQYIRAEEPSEQSARPRITLDAARAAPVAARLSTMDEQQVEGRARTAFWVSSDADADYTLGFVGLPLGSAEPDDLPPGPDQPPPVDPAVLAAQLADDTAGVTAFLTAAALAADVPGVPTVFVAECMDIEQSQVWGMLLLPVFEYTDSAEPGYAAIVAEWEADGYSHSDQATGTSIYTPSQTRPVMQANIRGTADGIQLEAIGACRG